MKKILAALLMLVASVAMAESKELKSKPALVDVSLTTRYVEGLGTLTIRPLRKETGEVQVIFESDKEVAPFVESSVPEKLPNLGEDERARLKLAGNFQLVIDLQAGAPQKISADINGKLYPLYPKVDFSTRNIDLID